MQNFTVFEDNNSEKFAKIYKNIFEEKYDKSGNVYNDLFKSNGIYISGSTVINMLNGETECNDLDIYIDIRKFSINKMKVLMFNLYSSNFSINEHFINKKTMYYEYMKIISNLEYLYKLYYNNKQANNNISKSHSYFSLAEYITKIYSLTNYKNGKKIDLIFIHCGIKTLIFKTFDFDINKNYYSKKKFYIHNFEAIKNKVATITVDHFYKRILNDIFEFKNFIIRYHKYSNRGYKVYIGDSLIHPRIVNYMSYILLINLFTESKNHIYNEDMNWKLHFNSPTISLTTGKITQTITKNANFDDRLNRNVRNKLIKFRFGTFTYTDLNIKTVLYNRSMYKKFKLNNIGGILKNVFIFHTKLNEEIIKKFWNPNNIYKMMIDENNIDFIDDL